MTVRIIAGRCRGRRLKTPAGPGMRPTPERVRETLFNWLAGGLDGARVLDLFAGSGALGLEALSRGAREAVFVERNPRHLACLRENVAACGMAGAVVRAGDAMTFLAAPATPFDVIFLDPPFGQGWPARLLPRLLADAWVAPGGRVYLETSAQEQPQEQDLPAPWCVHREGRCGDSHFVLLAREGER